MMTRRKRHAVTPSTWMARKLVCLLVMLHGITVSWSSPAVSKLTNSTTNPFGRDITLAEVTWITSLLSVGSAAGPFVYGWMPNRFGIRITMLVVGIPVMVSQVVMAFGTMVELFYVARFLEGLAIGGALTFIPGYVAEIAEKDNRGALGSFLAIAGSAGVVFSYSLGPHVSTLAYNLVIAILAAEFLILFFLVGEERPHYYLKNQDTDMARRVLRRLRGGASREITELELEEIKAQIDIDGPGNFLDIFRDRRLIKAFVMVIGLVVFQEACGATLSISYSQTLFEHIDSPIAPEKCSIIVGGMKLLSSFLSPHMVDRLGRKQTLYISATGVIVSEIVLGVYVHLHDRGMELSSYTFVPLVALVGLNCFFSSGLSFLPFIVLGEIFPPKVKASAAVLALSFKFVLSFLMMKYMEFFFESLGIAQSFFVFAVCTVICIVFVKFVLIETSGKSLKEIQDNL